MIKSRKCLEDIKPYVPGKPIDDVKRELGLDTVIKLASNENPFGCSEKVKEAIIKSFDNIQLYPDGYCTDLRNKLSKIINVTNDNLIFGCGADELITLLGRAFIDDGDEGITGELTFSQYYASIKTMNGKVVLSKMKNYGFNLQDILSKITDKTKIIFLANPNNPTGTVFSLEEQENFLSKVPKDIIVVLDQAYEEFAEYKDYPNSISLLDKYKNIVIIKTFSKAYGLASLRIGYAVANPEIITILEKIRNPFNVSIQAQIAATAALDDKDFLKKVLKNNSDVRNFLYNEFKEMGIEYVPTDTNFIIVDIKRDAKTAFNELMKKGYIVRPVANLDTFLRISFGTMEQIKGFVSALKEVLA